MADKPKENKPKLSSDEAKDKLKAGEELKGYYIERLNMSKMDIDFPIKIIECTIPHLDLNNSTFREEVHLRRCEVQMFVASDSVFKGKFDIKGIQIKRGRIQRAVFEDQVNGESAYIGFTSFFQSQFNGEKASFGYSTFGGDATFQEVKAKGEVKFTNATFEKGANFQKSEWEKPLIFTQTKTAEDVNFRDNKFHQDVFFNHSVIGLTLDLSNSEIVSGRTDFNNISVGRTLLLNNLTVGETMGFRFQNAQAPTIILERETVEGHVYPENDGEYERASKEYGFLRSTFEDINRFEDEDWAYYHFKRTERLSRPWTGNPIQLLLRMMNYIFLDKGCGYGTKPFRTLGVIAIGVLLFAGIYFMSPIPTEVSFGFGSDTVERAAYSLHLSLIAFSSYGDLDIEGPVRFLAMIEYMFGIVFMGLFIVAFSRKVIR